MTLNDHRVGVPDDWFIDPVRLGVPGVRSTSSDDNPLAWQTDSLCAQTDPEAFFPEKGGSTRDAKKICASCEVRSHRGLPRPRARLRSP
jgi:WhiB family redox-sensing transcriptional regulator